MTHKEKLIAAYSKNSKHSNYQVLPRRVRQLIDDHEIHTRTRYEKERLKYLLDKIDFKDKSVLDIGGNTGYFTFEVLDAGAARVTHYEGNKEHSDFVRLASEATGLQDRVQVVNNYFLFDGKYKEFHDIVLLFNVLHHLGDDYGDRELHVERAKEEIIKQLNSLAAYCDVLVFQLGFNWQGDTSKPLFKDGTKKEVIEFVKSGTENIWEVTAIGVAQVAIGTVGYNDLDESNVERNDSIGEFLNRPIFILKSRVHK